MSNYPDKAMAEVFAGTRSNVKALNKRPIEEKLSPRSISFSYLFFSDVRKDISDWEKYCFTRELVEFADASGFEAVYFPERHFYEFGSIYANNGIMAAYFAPLTQHVRLRTAAITSTLHHPVEIVENWAMIDILSNGRVDLGFGDGWNEADFILSPDTCRSKYTLS
ncbi:MAG: LLM class flavin-dependent oxidoreductase [Bacteroidota bacterium]